MDFVNVSTIGLESSPVAYSSIPSVGAPVIP